MWQEPGWEVKSEGGDRCLWSRWSRDGYGVTETKPEFDCVTILAAEVTF